MADWPEFEINESSPEVIKFLWKVLHINVYEWCNQEENIVYPLRLDPAHLQSLLPDIAAFKQRPKLQGMKLGEIEHYNYSEMKELTGNFSDHQLISKTTLGRLFCATISDNSKIRKATIKTWDLFIPCVAAYLDHPKRLVTELVMLTDGKLRSNPDTVLHPMESVLRSNKSVAKVIGYSCDKFFSVVYDVQVEQSIRDAIPSDTFDWKSRMRLAMEMAQLLKLVHGYQLSVGTIQAENIMIDKEGNFKLLGVGMHFLYIREHESCTSHRLDYFIESNANYAPEVWEDSLIKIDIYCFGILLLELITKEDQRLCEVGELTNESPLVDASFGVEGDSATKITDLVRSCLNWSQDKRPEMSQVVAVLQEIYGDLLADSTPA